MATQYRPNTSAPGDGSRTIIVEDAQPREAESSADEAPTIGTLRLRGAPRRVRNRVAWGEDVVDNEGCGKKSSKICCIYHKPKRFDESSSDDSSSSDSDSGSDSSCDHKHDQNHNDDRASRPHRHRPRSDGAQPSRGGESSQRERDRGAGVVNQLEDASEPNAYESIPGSKKGKKKAA